MNANQQWMIQEIARLNVEVERQDKAIIDKLYEVGKLKQQIAALVEALEAIDKLLSERQGLDYDYWSQEEKDTHEIVQQALALVEGDTDE